MLLWPLQMFYLAKYQAYGYNNVGYVFNTINVCPKEIKNIINEERFGRPIPIFGIVGGDWDERSYNMIESREYRLFVEHFEGGKEWEEIPEYREIIKSLEADDGFSGLGGNKQSPKKYREYLEYWDTIYKKMSEEGYKSQKELQGKFECITYPPSILNEVQIFIGKNGKLICKSGKHRLIVAQILDIKLIPVRVAIRHKQWQETREKISQGDILARDVDFQHPDLQDLLTD